MDCGVFLVRRYSITDADYIIAIGTGAVGGNEIPEAEYNEILAVIQSCPNEEGKGYKLRTDLTWEEYDAPTPVEEPSDVVSLTEIISEIEEVLAE